MISKLMLIILLHLTFLEKAASDGPCKFKLQLVALQTPVGKRPFNPMGGSPPKKDVDVEFSYRITRSSGASIETNTKSKTTPANQGSTCAYTNVVDTIEPSFTDCTGDFEVRSDITISGSWIVPWKNVGGKFKCDGNERSVSSTCQNNGHGAIKVTYTCTNEDHNYDKLFEKTTKDIGGMLDNEDDKLKQLKKAYNEMLDIILERNAHKDEIRDCAANQDSWVKHGSCRIHFFKPIFGVIASYVPQASKDEQKELDSWTNGAYMKSENWKTVPNNIAVLMKKALSKRQVDSNFFKRGMWYAQLHNVSSATFPWNESPVKQYKTEWYGYAKSSKDGDLQKLQNLLSVTVDDEVKTFCYNETEISPICSIVATMDYHNWTLAYHSNVIQREVISISPYIAENGLYSSLNRELVDFLASAKMQEAVESLGEKISTYFGTLATFDSQIAQADVGYIKSAIDKNNNRLTTNVEKMGQLVNNIKQDQQTCNALNIFESSLNIAIGIVGCFAGGAGALTAIQGINGLEPKLSEFKTKFLSRATALDTAMKSLQPIISDSAGIAIGAEQQQNINNRMKLVNGTVQHIMQKLGDNGQKIEGMGKIVQAIIEGTSLSGIKPMVDNFLNHYSDYTPAVIKDDLTQLTTNYTNMLESLETSFGSSGKMCQLFVGTAAAEKVRDAKGIWSSITTLLDDVFGQQSQLIDALVKAVRSKLDQSGAKTISPDVNNNFETLVRAMLAIRVSAQQVCDAYQFLKNDKQHKHCEAIRNKVLLSSQARTNISEIDRQLQKDLEELKRKNQVNTYFADIPVSSETTSIRAVNWDDLISGRVVEFSPPANDSKFLKDNLWNLLPDRVALLSSIEIFLPNIKIARDSSKIVSVRFNITAIQESVVINNRTKAQRYTLKSEDPISTQSWYTVDNMQSCGDNLKNDLFDEPHNGQYCLPADTGRFAPNMNPFLPVSMYSRFRIKLLEAHGYDRNTLQMFRPSGDTLKLRARLRVYSDPAESTKRRSGLRKTSTRPLQKRYCGEGVTEGCKSCPDGSIPVAHGSFCISLENAKKITDKLGTTVQMLNDK